MKSKDTAMSPIRRRLGDGIPALIARRAKASGLSKSGCVAEIAAKRADEEWPSKCLALAGRFADFPLREGAPDLPARS